MLGVSTQVAIGNRILAALPREDFARLAPYLTAVRLERNKVVYITGDQIRYVEEDPFLGQGANAALFVTLRPFSRLQSQIDLITSDLHDPGGAEVFDVKIYRALTTYQFTSRLLARNIAEYNSLNRTWAMNLLASYRINAGTVFFAGYDDHLQQGDRISADGTNPGGVFTTTRYRRTNRAFFTKLQYLFRR